MTDLDSLMEIMQCAFEPQWREAWTRQQVENSLAMPHTHAILINRQGEQVADGKGAVGFVLARRAPGEEELLLIAVRPDMRKRGLGTILLRLFAESARENGAERIFLEMRANNPAERLYRDFGFEPIGRRNHYYRTSDGVPIDAITFAMKL